MGKWFQPKEAAQYAGISVRTLRVWLKNGLEHSHISQKLILIHTDEIDQYIKGFTETHNREDQIDSIVSECVAEVMS